MERLHQLLHSLSPQQVKVLRNYLTSFSTRDSNTKFWELAALQLKHKDKVYSLKECSEKIYKTAPDGRIEQLKNRLYAKVLDSLLIDINTNRDIYEDETHPILIRLRKKMILYDLLKYTRLKDTMGLEMIKDIITVAKQYEFYPILLDAMYILKWNYGMRKGIQFFQDMNKQIEQVERSKGYAQRALDLYAQLGQFSTFNTKADKAKLEEYLQQGIDELRLYFIETGIKSIGYFLKTFEMTFCQINKRTKEAKDIAISLLEYMNEHKSVIGRKGRFGICYDYIAEFEVELGNYDSALKYVLEARPYFSGSQLNLAINKKLELDIHFLKGDYIKAKELADELSQTNTKVTGDFRRDMILYYKACCHFMLGEFRESARLLGQKFQITRDKLGWEVNIRFMRIMLMVELNKPDEAFAMVQSLQKHMERYKQLDDLNERDRMLMDVFRELAKEGFGFNRPEDKVYHLLMLLMEQGKPHSWEPLNPELVQIHKWIIRKYQHFLPPRPMSTEKRKPAAKKAKGNA